MHCYFLGKRPYKDVLRFQEAYFAAKIQRQRAIASSLRDGSEPPAAKPLPDAVFAVEHSAPQYTMGRRDTSSGLNDIPTQDVVQTRRGGALTWHGPGQLTCYPIVNVKQLWGESLTPKEVKGASPVRWFSDVLEESMIGAIKPYGLTGERDCVGVWVQGKKIGSIGLQLSDWVSMHGIGLNVANDLTYFDKIVMCAMPGRRATSVTNELNSEQARSGDAVVNDSFASSAASSATSSASGGGGGAVEVEEVYRYWLKAYQLALGNPEIVFHYQRCVEGDYSLDKLLSELTER